MGKLPLKLLIIFLVLLVPILLALNFALDKYGRFWEKKSAAPATDTSVGQLVPPAETATISISCPVPSEFCSTGKEIDEGEVFFGYVYKLPEGTQLLAAFSGKIEDEPKVPERVTEEPLLYLRDPQGNEVFYSFYGTSLVEPGTVVKKGTPIGKIGPGIFPPYPPFNDSNFSFGLKQGTKFKKIAFDKE